MTAALGSSGASAGGPSGGPSSSRSDIRGSQPAAGAGTPMRSAASASGTGVLAASTRIGADTGSVGRRRRRPGKAASTVPIAISSPPTHSHRRIGLTARRSVTCSSAAGDGLSEGQVDVLREAGPHRRRGDVVAPGLVELEGRRVDLPPSIWMRAFRIAAAGGVLEHLVDQLERVAAERRAARRAPAGSRRPAVARLRGEGHGDDDHAEVHDHAAVGPPDAGPASPAGGWPARAGAAPSRRRSRRARRRPAAPTPSAPSSTATTSAPTPHHAGQNSRSRSSSVDALRHGSTGRDRHQEQQGEADRRGHAVEVRARPTDDAAVLQRLDEQREHGAEQHDEGEHARTARCWRGTRPPGESGESIAPGERSRSPRQPISAERHDDDEAEERRAGRRRSGRR